MADVEMTTEVSPTQPVPSIEVKSDTKQEEEPEQEVGANADAEGSDNDNENDNDNDAPGDNDDEGIEVTDLTDGKISTDLYKSFKSITEVLLNFKIKSRANE